MYTNLRRLKYWNTWSNRSQSPEFFSPVARQPALTWQAVCTQIVARGSKVTTQVWREYDHPVLSYGTFSCIQYDVPVWPWPLTYFPKNWVTWPGERVECMCLFGSLQTLLFLKYSSINCRFSGLVARQPALPWQPFCATLVGVSSTWEPPSMKLMWPPIMELWHILPA